MKGEVLSPQQILTLTDKLKGPKIKEIEQVVPRIPKVCTKEVPQLIGEDASNRNPLESSESRRWYDLNP